MKDYYEIGEDQAAMDCTMLTINGEEAGVCLGSMDCDKCKRTTHLLAAARDMYEALECMIAGAAAVACPNAGERQTLQEAVNIAEAALARARGEE